MEEKVNRKRERVLKMKFDGTTVSVIYEMINSKGEFDKYSFESNDAPEPEFNRDLQDLAVNVVEISELLDLPDSPEIFSEVYVKKLEQERTKIEVRGLTFSYAGDKDVMGVTITALRTLRGSVAPLVINTPHKIEEWYSENGDTRQLMGSEVLRKLLECQYRALRYVNGIRAQVAMEV